MKDKLNKDLIKNSLNYDIPCFIYDSVDSTNIECKRIIDKNNNKCFLVVSEEQTNGRGRLGRSFYSPKYNGIYMSFVYGFEEFNESIVNITTITASIVTKVLETLTNKDLKIKWVNDIYFQNRKLCGILSELHMKNIDNNNYPYIIIGIGINVFYSSFPDELKNIAISLDFDGVSRNEIISGICNELYEYVNEKKYLNNESQKKYIEYYKEHSNVLGKNISYEREGIKYTGLVMDISNNGELLIQKENDEIEILRTGEITIRVVK